MTTGGTVGTAAWVFAATRLKIPVVALSGVCLGYYRDTPLTQTQTYYELIEEVGSEKEVEKYYVQSEFPLTGERFYTDPTYFWYRLNFIDMLRKTPDVKTYNCTEAGTLVDDSVECVWLDQFLKEHR
jgi:hypothetical protein